MKVIDISGITFGRLIAVRRTAGRGTPWLCECECGNEAVVLSGNLRAGRTRSCGCLGVELRRERATIYGPDDTCVVPWCGDRPFSRWLCKSHYQQWSSHNVDIEFFRSLPSSCAICGTDDTSLHIDHCHVAGGVRGVLCSECNLGLGKLGDDEAGLLRALRYLRSPSGQVRDLRARLQQKEKVG